VQVADPLDDATASYVTAAGAIVVVAVPVLLATASNVVDAVADNTATTSAARRLIGGRGNLNMG
jgi:hypothetical protein